MVVALRRARLLLGWRQPGKLFGSLTKYPVTQVNWAFYPSQAG